MCVALPLMPSERVQESAVVGISEGGEETKVNSPKVTYHNGGGGLLGRQTTGLSTR